MSLGAAQRLQLAQIHRHLMVREREAAAYQAPSDSPVGRRPMVQALVAAIRRLVNRRR